ncbi:MAG: hypothetical protein ABEJ86_03225 [Halococcoides sp.]
MSDDAGRTLAVEVPDAVADWLDDHGADPDTAAGDLLRAHRSVAEDPASAIEPAVASVLADRMDAIADAVVERLDPETADEGDLAALEDRVDAVETGQRPDPEQLRDRIATLEERLEDTESACDRQFSEIAEKLDRLAWAVIESREQSDEDRALERIMSAAHAAGVDHAACADCGRTVDLGLLTASRCPHCEGDFADLEPSSGWFGSSTLVGDAPEVESDG